MKRTGFILSFLLVLLVSTIGLSGVVDLYNLLNYSNQNIPSYINKDNTNTNAITDEGATLGRVLFYDKNLSSDKTVSCATCHIQEFAFSDTAVVSQGVNGLTGRHSTRLINNRFGSEQKFFWDERAATLEEQSTMPIHDHKEMGFSDSLGAPSMDDLLLRLDSIGYYNQLFLAAFGDTIITEERMQFALAQFMRSIQSFDSKFDAGLALTNDITVDFPNYTTQENLGKFLFLNTPFNGGANCATCHNPPEFDIDPFSQNNGVVHKANGEPGLDLTNTRSPSLRDLKNDNGVLNGPMMHTGDFTDLMMVVEHYDSVPKSPANTNLDQRLMDGGEPQYLGLTQTEKEALVAFLETLSGTDVYTNEKWANPFDSNGDITVLGGYASQFSYSNPKTIQTYPNPATDHVNLVGNFANTIIELYNQNGQLVGTFKPQTNSIHIELTGMSSGIYLLNVIDPKSQLQITSTKILKQ